jgi:hypothetical protein
VQIISSSYSGNRSGIDHSRVPVLEPIPFTPRYSDLQPVQRHQPENTPMHPTQLDQRTRIYLTRPVRLQTDLAPTDRRHRYAASGSGGLPSSAAATGGPSQKLRQSPSGLTSGCATLSLRIPSR